MMRTLRLAAAAVAAAAVLFVAGTLPAAAHDELVASSPETGERLAAAPETVTLTFSAAVLTVGAAVVVADESGHDWVVGEATVADGVVTVTLADGMPDAGYEIRWRVVSSDGHPISGIVPFTIGDGEPFTRTAPSGEKPTTTEDSESAPADPSVPRTVLIGAGGAAVALALLLIITFLRRRRGAEATPQRAESSNS